jgi:hypothetical protein
MDNSIILRRTISTIFEESPSGDIPADGFSILTNFQDAAAFVFDVLVQLGTLLVVIIFFWKDLVGIIGTFLTGLARRQPFADPLGLLGR